MNSPFLALLKLWSRFVWVRNKYCAKRAPFKIWMVKEMGKGGNFQNMPAPWDSSPWHEASLHAGSGLHGSFLALLTAPRPGNHTASHWTNVFKTQRKADFSLKGKEDEESLKYFQQLKDTKTKLKAKATQIFNFISLLHAVFSPLSGFCLFVCFLLTLNKNGFGYYSWQWKLLD